MPAVCAPQLDPHMAVTMCCAEHQTGHHSLARQAAAACHCNSTVVTIATGMLNLGVRCS
jgi:hypothetical protein